MEQPKFCDFIINISQLPPGVIPRILLVDNERCTDMFLPNSLTKFIETKYATTITPQIERERISLLQIETVPIVESPVLTSVQSESFERPIQESELNPNQALLMDTPREVKVEITIKKGLKEKYLEFCKKHGKNPSIIDRPFFSEELCHFELSSDPEVECMNGNDCSFAHSKEEMNDKFEIIKTQLISSTNDPKIHDLIETIFKLDKKQRQIFIMQVTNGKIPFKVACRSGKNCENPNCYYAHVSRDTQQFLNMEGYSDMVKALHRSYTTMSEEFDNEF